MAAIPTRQLSENATMLFKLTSQKRARYYNREKTLSTKGYAFMITSGQDLEQKR